jgi:hypothetical protein
MRLVKDACVLADMMKAGPFDSQEGFMASLQRFRTQIRAFSDAQIDAKIHLDRRQRFDIATWKLEKIALPNCCVWPQMGSKVWATGSVHDVAAQFKALVPPDKQIACMLRFTHLYESHLPIIVIKTNSRLEIDDGSHRAIAMAINGIETVTAWVGQVPGMRGGLHSAYGT